MNMNSVKVILLPNMLNYIKQKTSNSDFPGDPVAKTVHSHCRVLRIDLWSENEISHAATLKKKKRKKRILHVTMKMEDPACCN